MIGLILAYAFAALCAVVGFWHGRRTAAAKVRALADGATERAREQGKLSGDISRRVAEYAKEERAAARRGDSGGYRAPPDPAPQDVSPEEIKAYHEAEGRRREHFLVAAALEGAARELRWPRKW